MARHVVLFFFAMVKVGCVGADVSHETAALTPTASVGALNITGASVENEDEEIVAIRFSLAEPAEGAALVNPADEYWWVMAPNTGPGFPTGWPRAAGIGIPVEFQVAVRLTRDGFSAFVSDRRPLLAGQPAIVRFLDDYEVEGTELTIWVDRALLGGGDRFCYLAFGLAWARSPMESLWDAGDGTYRGLAGNESLNISPPHVPQWLSYGGASCP